MSADEFGAEPGAAADGVGGPADGPGTAESAPEEQGPDAVRTALNRARAAARERGLAPGTPGRGTGRSGLPGTGAGVGLGAGRRRRGVDADLRSGAHPDGRDPQTLGSALARLVSERGWQTPVAVGGVIGRWDAVVGAEIAAHCTPEDFTDGVLAVRADSTAWATQVRLLVPTLMRRLAEEVGEGTVTKVIVRAPTAPSWRRGPRVAPGSHGPRDTYG